MYVSGAVCDTCMCLKAMCDTCMCLKAVCDTCMELGTRFGHSSEHLRVGRDRVTGSLFCCFDLFLSVPHMCSGRRV